MCRLSRQIRRMRDRTRISTRSTRLEVIIMIVQLKKGTSAQNMPRAPSPHQVIQNTCPWLVVYIASQTQIDQVKTISQVGPRSKSRTNKKVRPITKHLLHLQITIVQVKTMTLHQSTPATYLLQVKEATSTQAVHLPMVPLAAP